MKTLLNNRFAPVTFSWGFLEKPLSELVEFQINWTKSLFQSKECKLFEADLPCALQSLEPLDAANVLFLSTRSAWTAVFQGCVGVTSPLSQISYPAEMLHCRGLMVTCTEDTFDKKSGKGLYGGVSFEMFAPHPTAFLNCDRVVSAINDAGKWVFHTFGIPKEFERSENYLRKKVRDRFTVEMLDEYCSALGIRLFDPKFYGPACALVYATTQQQGGTNKTYHDVKLQYGLED